ncbi:MAG: hypothetical protein LBJ12_02585 [Oscillospiraceae bacterium]|nr:hypothetical protein [Oscillospiraceae bacterium]
MVESRASSVSPEVGVVVRRVEPMGIQRPDSTIISGQIKNNVSYRVDRLMLIELIDRIYVNEDKSLKIEFNFNNQYLLIMDFIKQNNPTLAKTLQKKK